MTLNTYTDTATNTAADANTKGLNTQGVLSCQVSHPSLLSGSIRYKLHIQEESCNNT